MEKSVQSETINHWSRMAKLKAWAGVIAARALQDHQAEQLKNQQAENAFVRTTAWGAKDGEEGEDMAGGHTFLGDVVQQPSPIIMPGNAGSDLLKLILVGALAAGVPGAGIAGYLLSQQSSTPTPPISVDSETVDIGLGKIEDYLSE